MEITLELDESLVTTLKRVAEAKGETPAEFVKHALREQLKGASQNALSPEERARRIEEAIAAIAAGKSDLGRNGLPWREFIHEGHKY